MIVKTRRQRILGDWTYDVLAAISTFIFIVSVLAILDVEIPNGFADIRLAAGALESGMSISRQVP